MKVPAFISLLKHLFMEFYLSAQLEIPQTPKDEKYRYYICISSEDGKSFGQFVSRKEFKQFVINLSLIYKGRENSTAFFRLY